MRMTPGVHATCHDETADIGLSPPFFPDDSSGLPDSAMRKAGRSDVRKGLQRIYRHVVEVGVLLAPAIETHRTGGERPIRDGHPRVFIPVPRLL